MPTARAKANRKYNEKAYDRANLYFKKGEKDCIKEAAQSAGQSVNEYIHDAVERRMKEEGFELLALPIENEDNS